MQQTQALEQLRRVRGNLEAFPFPEAARRSGNPELACLEAELAEAEAAVRAGGPEARRAAGLCPECGGGPGQLVCGRCRKLSVECTCMDRVAIKAGECVRIPCPSADHPV